MSRNAGIRAALHATPLRRRVWGFLPTRSSASPSVRTPASRRFRTLLALLLSSALSALSGASSLSAQSRDSLGPTNQEIFRQMDLPTPNGVRTGGGAPGAEYWQNRADYDIRVALDTLEHRVIGSETIHYVNESPDPLDFVWIQLEQNLFRPGSRGSLVNGGNRWRGFFPGGGVSLDRVEVVREGERITPERTVDGTRMRVDLARPLEPEGGTLDLEIDWSFVVPEYGADRMGRFRGDDGWVYEIAQWYPRMYVYDDVDGWNPLPFLGQGEFYLEYGDFDVSVTVPRGMIVLATGTLENEDEVLTEEQRRRLRRARESEETIRVVQPDEVGSPESRPDGSGPLTWRFHAQNVRDFSWAASRAFIWDATSWEDVLIMAAYPREGLGSDDEPGWERAARYARHSISYYSETWYPYPYPVAINVAGTAAGMEYPMIVFCGVGARGVGLFGVTDHELGHSWFPMVVGSDERRWAWMDEGFNTFMNHYSNIDFLGPEGAAAVGTTPEQMVEQLERPIADQPILTNPDDLRRSGLGLAAYRKPGYGLVLLREVILGSERFDDAFREYIRRWAYKHPQPADFFRTMEEVSGEDLDWFWRGWFLSTDELDQAVTSVDVNEEGAEVRSSVHLENRGGLVMPVELELVDAGGSRSRTTLPVEIWATGDRYTLTVSGRRISEVVIDPEGRLPDVVRSNNRWPTSRR